MELQWLGNTGWLFRDQDHLIGVDLDLNHSMRSHSPLVSAKEIAPDLEYLFITHEHGDHFNLPTCSELVRYGTCRFVLPESCRPGAEEIGIPGDRIQPVTPRTSYAAESWLAFDTFRALHGHHHQSVYERANLFDCGYLITFGGKRLFVPGDTVLLSEHLSLSDLDVLFFSPTEHNTWIDHSVLLIETVRPRCAVAQHFGTYDVTEDNAYWTVGYPREVKERLSEAMASRTTIPEPETWFSP